MNAVDASNEGKSNVLHWKDFGISLVSTPEELVNEFEREAGRKKDLIKRT